MAYGTVKADSITFTSNSADVTTTLSGIYASTTNNLTLTGTASAVTFTGTTANFVSGVFSTQISGVTITGTTIAATTGNFTSLTGTTTTGTTANFVSGVFSTQVSGVTITGTTVATTTGTFTSLTGTTATFTSGIIASGTAALPSLAILSDPNTGIFSPGADQLAVATNGTRRLLIDSAGALTLDTGDATIYGVRVGRGAGASATNTVVGNGALQANTTGLENVAIGSQTLSANTAGNDNIAIGYQTLLSNTTADSNIALGYWALKLNTTGTNNNAIGVLSLISNTTGGGNNALGLSALRFNTTGNNNIAVGLNSLYDNTTGSTNTCLGYQAGTSLTTGSNNTIIGSIAGTAGLADTVIIGAGTTERLRIDSSGRLLVGTSTATAMDSSSKFGSATPRQNIFENTAAGGAAFVNIQGSISDAAVTRIAGINFALADQTNANESNKSASFYVKATDGHANTPSLFISVANADAISIPTSGIANFINGLTIPTGKTIAGAGTINMSSSSGHKLTNNTSSLCLTTESTTDGSIIVFDRSGAGQGSISVATGTVSYNQFLGSHWAALTDWSRPNIKLGTILETINELTDWKYAAIEVDGKQKKICYNGTAAPGDIVSVEYEGETYEGIVELETNPKFNKTVKVKVNNTAASKAVYGVFVGWNTDSNLDGGIWNDMYVGAVGNYVIRMAVGETPEIGDLVEADGAGCAVIQDDDIIRTKTVAKITNTIPQVTYDDGSFLVTCVLYCG